MKMRWKRRIRVASLCCVALLATQVLTGCGRFKKPSTVVHSMYMDCQNGEYPKARHLFIEDMRAESDGSLPANGQGIKMICDQLTNSGTLNDVEIKSEAMLGDRATVVADVHLATETRFGERTNLEREDGVWKVVR